MSSTNGAVMLGREMRLRLSPQHRTSLEALAKMHGWSSPTELAEKLLQDAIERAANNTALKHVSAVVITAWQAARVG